MVSPVCPFFHSTHDNVAKPALKAPVVASCASAAGLGGAPTPPIRRRAAGKSPRSSPPRVASTLLFGKRILQSGACELTARDTGSKSAVDGRPPNRTGFARPRQSARDPVRILWPPAVASPSRDRARCIGECVRQLDYISLESSRHRPPHRLPIANPPSARATLTPRR